MMQRTGIVSHGSLGAAYESVVIDEVELLHVKARHAGIFYRLVNAGSRVFPGESLAHIIDPYNGQILNPQPSRRPTECIAIYDTYTLIFDNDE